VAVASQGPPRPLRHDEHAHLQTNVEKLALPILGTGSMLPFCPGPCLNRRFWPVSWKPLAPAKSDLRNHQAIVQPRLYDYLMVTQITLNTEPHGLDSSQGHSYGKKVTTTLWSFVVPEAPAKLCRLLPRVDSWNGYALSRRQLYRAVVSQLRSRTAHVSQV
jgi:hypothetical protein